MAQREFDVVVFGATGYTGRFVAQHLARHGGPGLKLALAGRDAKKLEAVVGTLGGVKPALVVVDALDPRGLAELAPRTKVVCTTVGPYQKYGLPLIEACAAAGTHTCDLNGEVLYMRDCVDRFHATAVASGARIVLACGFDSIPSDLAMLALHQHLASLNGNPALKRATLVIESLRGGFSGGTFASFITTLDAASGSKERRRILYDPYSLSPDRSKEPDLGDERDPAQVKFDPFLGKWTAPFMMSTMNTRVVRRSNALLGHAYGKSLRYQEVFGFKPGLGPLIKGSALPFAFLGIARALTFGPTRRLVEALLPKPGQGPDETKLDQGSFRLRLVAELEDGRRFHALVKGQGDPGYGSTPHMMGEAALALAFDEPKLPKVAGVLTPATAIGAALLPRLRAHGVAIDVAAD